MGKANEDLRLWVFKSGLSYRENDTGMKFPPLWPSRAMTRKNIPGMKRRITVAVDGLIVSKRGRS